MRQFNLEEYLANPNKKVITRSGNEVRIVCTNRKSENCPIVALIQDSTDDFEDAHYYTIYGKWVIGGDDSMDLFFVPEKKEGWINIYKSESMAAPIGGTIYDSKEEAETEGKRDKKYIATVKIEWEEE